MKQLGVKISGGYCRHPAQKKIISQYMQHKFSHIAAADGEAGVGY